LHETGSNFVRAAADPAHLQLAIGGLMIAMYLPIFQLGNVF